MNLDRLLLLSGQRKPSEPVIKESMEDDYEEAVKAIWDDSVVDIEEMFVDYEELYSYVNSEFNIDNSKMLNVKGVVDEFANKFQNSDQPVGLDKDMDGEAALQAINNGLDQLEAGEFASAMELLIVGYQKATEALIDIDKFKDKYSAEIDDYLYDKNTDPYTARGLSRSDFL